MHTQIMEVHNSKEASDFYGHGLTHSRRPRPKRGSQHEDSEQDKGNDKASGNSQERNPLPLIFEISLPFRPRPALCQGGGSGQFILLNVNNAILHFRTHHRSSFHAHNVRRIFLPNTPRSATCQKCPGPPTPLDSGRTL